MCPGWIHILHTFSCLSWITRKYWGPVAVLNCVEYGNDLTKSLNFTFRNLVPSAMLVPGHILLLIGEAAETPHPCSFRITSLSVVYAGSSKNDTTVSSLVAGNPVWRSKSPPLCGAGRQTSWLASRTVLVRAGQPCSMKWFTKGRKEDYGVQEGDLLERKGWLPHGRSRSGSDGVGMKVHHLPEGPKEVKEDKEEEASGTTPEEGSKGEADPGSGFSCGRDDWVWGLKR
ncbi:unnamed protein product [Gadus morhua 'NCC']